MFVVNDDLSIYVTRGDTLFFNVSADDHGYPYKFQPGNIVRFAVYGRKDAETCVLQKDFPVTEVSETVFIYLEEQDTKIGNSISKHKDYWYEVVLNPDTIPQTLIGYDEDGAKIFRLFPESEEIDDNYNPQPEDFPVIDEALDMTSPRPVSNKAIARELATILDVCERTNKAVAEVQVTPQMFGAIGDGVADDTESFQAAVDQLGVTASKLIVPYGVYRLSDSIVLDNKSNIQIIGMGNPVIKFDSQDETTAGFFFRNYKDIEVSGFSFVSTRDKIEYPPAGHGNVGYNSSNILAIYLTGGENAIFRDNHFTGMNADYWIIGGGGNKNILVDGWVSNDASMPTYCSYLDNVEFRHSRIVPATEIGSGNHAFYISTKSKGVRIIDCVCEAKDNTFSSLISHYNASDETDESIQPVDLLVKDFKGKGARLLVGNRFSKVRFENVEFEQVYANYLTNHDENGAEYSNVDCVLSHLNELTIIGSRFVTINAGVVFEGPNSKKLLLEDSTFELGTNRFVLVGSKAVIKNCDIVCGMFMYCGSPYESLDVYVSNCRIKSSGNYVFTRRNNNNGVFLFANNVITANNGRFYYSAETSDCTGVTLLNNYMFNLSETFKLGSASEIANIVKLNNYVNGASV